MHSTITIIRCLLLSFLVLSPTLVVANVLVDEERYSFIGKYIETMAENGAELSLDEARDAFEMGLFTASEQTVPNFGIGAQPRWLTFQFNNTSEQKLNRRMVIENSWLDRINIYQLHNGELVDTREMGDKFPLNRRGIDHRFFIFDGQYDPGLSQLFIRIETPDPTVLPLFFGMHEDYDNRNIFNSYTYGLFYGILLGLMLYNLILFMRIRHMRYFFYVVYLAAFTMMNISYTGHGYYLLWSHNSVIQQWANPFFITLYALTGVVFALAFLHTRHLYPRLFKLTYAVSAFFIIAQALLFRLEMQREAVMLAIFMVMLFSFFTMSLALFSVRKRREVVYFLIAVLTGMTGVLITAMSVWSLIPITEWSYRAGEIGLAVDAILLSFALAEQFRIIQDEKLFAENMARIDPLTGLFNRRAFDEIAVGVMHNIERDAKALSVAIIDIDNFKVINDTYGHGVGDEVLKATAQTMSDLLRKRDVVTRWGGEEFVILLPETAQSHAFNLAERLMNALRKVVIETEQGALHFTVSMGISSLQAGNNETVETLIKHADEKLYLAKQRGRNQICT